MAKLRKVISGGQTGADRTSLECAKALGLETGGTAPKNYRTDEGCDKTLKDFGLIESPYYDYGPRTRDNVRDGDATIWFGKTGSPGFYCTKNACRTQDKAFFINPTDVQLEFIVNTYDVVNCAGNRKRLYPDVVPMTEAAFRVIGKYLGKNSSSEA